MLPFFFLISKKILLKKSVKRPKYTGSIQRNNPASPQKQRKTRKQRKAPKTQKTLVSPQQTPKNQKNNPKPQETQKNPNLYSVVNSLTKNAILMQFLFTYSIQIFP
jgi:hypothetical protein